MNNDKCNVNMVEVEIVEHADGTKTAVIGDREFEVVQTLAIGEKGLSEAIFDDAQDFPAAFFGENVVEGKCGDCDETKLTEQEQAVENILDRLDQFTNGVADILSGLNLTVDDPIYEGLFHKLLDQAAAFYSDELFRVSNGL